MSNLCASINKALNVASRPPELTLAYGTAGFRCVAEPLRHAMIRCGMLAVLRSSNHQHQLVGVCVTASHNPVEDNGVKIVEPDGGMLVPEYERCATEFVNSSTPFSTLEELVQELCKMNLSTASEDCFKKCRVVVARDTRPSSPVLAELVKLGVGSMGATFVDIGIATTPMLHWTVLTRHDDADASARQPEEFHQAYYQFWLKRAQEFKELMNTSGLDCSKPIELVCDAACGVGAGAMEAMKDSFRVFNCNVTVRNSEVTETVNLNDRCGAEHVQKNRQLPLGFGKAAGDQPGLACVSLDGDADRVVFFITPENEDEPLRTIIDGDRIAVTLSMALMKLIRDCVASKEYVADSDATLSVGCVQTAYANGASTTYLKNHLAATTPAGTIFDVAIAKTGVKNVHHAALNYDVGVYFESNGHGTIAYKKTRLQQWADSRGIGSTVAFKRVLAFLALINDCVGDAIVDALVMIASMRLLNLDFAGPTDSVLSMYPDLHVYQSKVRMSREKLNQLKSHPVHELHLIEPTDVQAEIDAAVAKCADARAFVRASGTEDACRIYAEAENQAAAAQLAENLKVILEQF